MNKIVGNFLQSRAPQPAAPVGEGPNVQQPPQQLGPVNGLPAWPAGTNLSVHIYFSTSPLGDVFGVTNRKNWGQAEATGFGFPHWTWDNITYGDWADSRKKDVVLEIPMVSFGLHVLWRKGKFPNGRCIDNVLLH